MIFAWDITILAGKTAASPKTQILKLSKGIIVKVEVKFVRGCHGMVKVRLRHEESQLVPLSRDEWITGDDESVTFPEFFELKTGPYQLKFVGCSPGTRYNHTVTVRISVLPKLVASMIPVINLLSRLLQRMGVFR